MSLLGSTQTIIRGATVQFATNFYDVNGVIIQPDSAIINIVQSLAESSSVTVNMTAPSGGETRWTALFDTRDIPAPQIIYWSIHTGTADPVPVVAEDGQFQLQANPANLLTF